MSTGRVKAQGGAPWQSCLNRLSMSPTRPLRLKFFTELNVSPAWPKHSGLALPVFATQAREQESIAKVLVITL